MQANEKTRAMILGGAMGDVFGAPLEILKLPEIRAKYGPQGLQEFAPYDSQWLDGAPGGLGAITDDTTMTAVTLDALAQHGTDDWEVMWQAYLIWVQPQMGASGVEKFISGRYVPSETVKPFLFRCGAGKGTIAALLEGRIGTLEEPLAYERTIEGKLITGPNRGCGGMMRVAPYAATAPSAREAFLQACKNTAITHGHPEAIMAAGAVAFLLHLYLHGTGIKEGLAQTQKHLENQKAPKTILKAFTLATGAAQKNLACLDTIDALPAQLGLNVFLAASVLSQMVYVLESVAHTGTPDFKSALRLAANHGGDSDSVAALVGQALGAAGGLATLPQDWAAQIPLYPALNTLLDKTLPRIVNN